MKKKSDIKVQKILIQKHLNKELSHNEYKALNDKHQDRMTTLYRGMKIKMLFLQEEYQQQSEKFYNDYLIIVGKIYEGFYAPDTPFDSRMYDTSETTYSELLYSRKIK